MMNSTVNTAQAVEGWQMCTGPRVESENQTGGGGEVVSAVMGNGLFVCQCRGQVEQTQ